MKLEALHNKPVQSTVDTLKRALAEAEKGQLRSVAIVGDRPGGNRFTAYDTDDIFSMIASLELLKYDLLSAGRKVYDAEV